MAKLLLIIVGVLSVLAGLYAIFNPLPATLAATLIAGWAFLILGLLQVFAVFRIEGWGGKIWALIVGVAMALVGVRIVGNPIMGALALTWVLAILFVVSGLSKVILGLSYKGIEYRGLIIISGVVSVVLGIMVFSNFPYSAAVILGVLLGIELLSNGVAALAMSFSGETPVENQAA
jgi:membrane protein HdeD